MTARTGLIVCVTEAEPLVAHLRQRYDESARMGVPAHITVLFPFMPPSQIDESILRRLQQVVSKTPAFEFSLRTLNRFPATAYLEPEPAQPFIAMTQNLVSEFPHYPPFEGQFATLIPHLTIADGDAGEAALAATEMSAALRTHGAIRSTCEALVLLENSSGLWKPMHVFPLAARESQP